MLYSKAVANLHADFFKALELYEPGITLNNNTWRDNHMRYVINQLKNHPSDPINTRNVFGSTLLLDAVFYCNDLFVIKCLIEAGATTS